MAQRSSAETQSELLELQRRLAQAERLAALGALVATLAHELGTPLHSVAGHLDLVLDEPELPAAARERLAIVAGEVERLSGLIRKHLRRLRAPLPEPRPTDVNRLVAHIVEVMRPLFLARGIDCVSEFARGAAVELRCDPDQIEQVVLNLVQNALDAMPDGGRLEIRTSRTAHGRAISVADSGRGVAPEHLGRVFDPFFSTKRSDEGTGLGLALCLEIARSHGGDIVLDSKPGVGTVVTLTLGEVAP